MHSKQGSDKENLVDLFNSLEPLKIPANKRQPSTSLISIVSFASLANRINKSKPLEKLNSLHQINTARNCQSKPVFRADGYTHRQKTTQSPEKIYKALPTNESVTIASFYKTESEQDKVLHLYSQDILNHLVMKQRIPYKCLSNHTIPPNLRAKMIDWMVEVLTSYKCTDQTLFLSVQIMDTYLSKTTKSHAPTDLHLLGVTSMFMASKYEEIYPLKLNVVYEKIAHKKITKEEIKAKEEDIMITLQFDFVYVTLFEIVMHLNQKLITGFKLSNKSEGYLRRMLQYITKLIIHDYELISTIQDWMSFGGSLIAVVLRIAEKLDTTLQPDDMTNYLAKIIKCDQDMLVKNANLILKVVKGFEQKFPQLNNLKKFQRVSFND